MSNTVSPNLLLQEIQEEIARLKQLDIAAYASKGGYSAGHSRATQNAIESLGRLKQLIKNGAHCSSCT